MNPRAARSSSSPVTGSRLSERSTSGWSIKSCPSAELEATVLAMADRIAQMPRFGLALTKKAVSTRPRTCKECEPGWTCLRSAPLRPRPQRRGLHRLLGWLGRQVHGGSQQGAGRRVNLDFSPEYPPSKLRRGSRPASNVPSGPLPSMDTAEGFAAHQEWEARLFEARWAGGLLA